MQVAPRKLLRQQVILKGLGFYSGPLDGIWGPQSIEAMSRFERRLELYRPARPVNGMPFADNGPYPKGIYLVENGLLYHASIEEFKEEELKAAGEVEAAQASVPVPQRIRAAREKAAAKLQPAVADPKKAEDDAPAEKPVQSQKPVQPQQNQQKNQR